ncbi:WD40 repeat-like protein [Ramaria rubella]|nr:WD40 repeat-like protein [Ramaria rubella]
MTNIQKVARVALSDRTNTSFAARSDCERTLKRRISVTEGRSEKRAKVDSEEVAVEDVEKHTVQTVFVDKEIIRTGVQNGTTFNALRVQRMRPRRASQNVSFSTRPLLKSFVSSNKSDVWRFHSRDDPIAPGLPFACAFTSDAKRGGAPLLAVATEDGTIELLNVAKRQGWDFEPQRVTMQVHENAILDVKWGMNDRYLATSSGDSTTRITDVTTQQSLAVLAYHTSSVKTLDWDPDHSDVLSTAGRDGSICVWDLRVSNQDSSSIAPVVVITHAHCDAKSRGKTAKSRSTSKTVTSILYLPQNPRQLISSGSFDGVLRQWDLRYPMKGQIRNPVMMFKSCNDPTLASGSRGRGISSLALGRNHSSGLVWGMAADSCIHTYTLPLSAPTSQEKLTHPGLLVNSFYVKLAASPCGSWLASGSSGGGVYLWDVANRSTRPEAAVELKPMGREIGAVDWTRDSLATCCDDGTVRIWRPDATVSAICRRDAEGAKWEWAWTTNDD